MIKKAFSISECVITMGLIVIATITSLTAIFISEKNQQNALENIEIYSKVELFNNSFNKVMITIPKSDNEIDKDKFINSYIDLLMDNFSLIKNENIYISNDKKYTFTIKEFTNENYKTYSYKLILSCDKYEIYNSINIRTTTYYYNLYASRNNEKHTIYTINKEY